MTNPSIYDHIKPNRDYYDAVSNQQQTSPSSPFNGTSGMGFGTLANRGSLPQQAVLNRAEALAIGSLTRILFIAVPQRTLGPVTMTVYLSSFADRQWW